MICYKDRVFCAGSFSGCKNHACDRLLTDEDIADAEKLGLGISVGVFKSPSCGFKREADNGKVST